MIPLADGGLLDSLEPKCNPPKAEVIILDSFKSPVLGSILCPHPCLSFFTFKCMLSCYSLIYPYKSLLNAVGNREVQTHKVVVIFFFLLILFDFVMEIIGRSGGYLWSFALQPTLLDIFSIKVKNASF